ncbi:hypothetical protein PanWU01x14_181540 [Parasponia andersonii]|uniref:Uncharacterized protein n=1 Tax=Parasponia andersonii TaxID=3476 RepID=A0A2P5C635_PARAD|nr:hypothetical protein PanWU01x14_181540 [Parasponia andersonii]
MVQNLRLRIYPSKVSTKQSSLLETITCPATSPMMNPITSPVPYPFSIDFRTMPSPDSDSLPWSNAGSPKL